MRASFCDRLVIVCGCRCGGGCGWSCFVFVLGCAAVCCGWLLLCGGWLWCVAVCGQVAEGTWWMPWHQEPMKDVGGRDRPGGAVNRAVIPGCPNGGTQYQSCGATCA